MLNNHDAHGEYHDPTRAELLFLDLDSGYSHLSIPHLLLIPVGTAGDSMDRVMLRSMELLTSTLVVAQCIALLCTTSSSGGVHSMS